MEDVIKNQAKWHICIQLASSILFLAKEVAKYLIGTLQMGFS
jgi:hypothetical protein